MYTNAVGKTLNSSGTPTNWMSADSGNSSRIGTTGNDVFQGVVNDIMAGGLGDDTYYVWDSSASIVEKSGEGVDTMVAQFWGIATLPANVENLVLASKGSTGGIGNALDNIITAGPVAATLDGGAGNDVLVGGIGADIFKVTKGNGSDAIVNFETSHDVVLLQGYGITDFSQLQHLGKQVGADTQFTFANGETLVLRNVALTSLNAWDFGFQAPHAAAAGYTLQSGATAATAANGWYVLNNAWNVGSLKYGTDFTVDSSYSVADMTHGTTFNWAFPQTTDTNTVIRAYPNVLFGVGPMGDTTNLSDKTHTFPIQVSNLLGLTADYDVSYKGNAGGFNVAYDIWFTKVANGGPSTVTNEVMIWLHQGDVKPSGEVIGTISVTGFSGTIYHLGTYTALVPDHDLPSGTIDIAAIIAKLQDMKIISGSEYLASVELGSEVVSGIGSLTINNLDLNVRTKGGNGDITDTIVTGSGATATKETTVSSAFGVKTSTMVVNSTTTSQQWRDASGALLKSDTTQVSGTSVTVKHFDSHGTLMGSEVSVTAANGSVTTQRFDATQALIGADTKSTANGVVTIQHFDAAMHLIGTDTTKIRPDGVQSTTHYDAAMKVIGMDNRLVGATGTITLLHFDGKYALTGSDVTTKASDGTTTTYHNDAHSVFKGADVVRTAATGVSTDTVYDAHWNVADTIFSGTDGNDVIHGTTAKNEFHGGLGSDTLYAGTGKNAFYFDTVAGGDVDNLIGFSSGRDSLYLDHSIFKGIASGNILDNAEFTLGAIAKDSNDHILYDKATGNIYYDADGVGGAAAILFAHVAPNTPLAASDFHIYP